MNPNTRSAKVWQKTTPRSLSISALERMKPFHASADVVASLEKHRFRDGENVRRDWPGLA